MLNFFPKYFSNRAMLCYLITLVIVSFAFIRYALPFQFMLFGAVAIVVFFYYSSSLTRNWRRFPPRKFVRNLFFVALIIRVIYVVFIYYYYIEMTGRPNMFHFGDEMTYEYYGEYAADHDFQSFMKAVNIMSFSDRGYCFWIGMMYRIFGAHVFSDRMVKCVVDAFTCVLMYSLTKRNFGEFTGRMAAIFYMLIPNAWYYCGLSLKETIMAFLVVLYVERSDNVIHSRKILLKDLILPAVIRLVMFTFRTALGAVLVAALAGALILNSGRQLELWKKVLYVSIFGIWMMFTVGAEMIEETQQLWEGRTENQAVGYEWRSNRKGGNSFAKYATASAFAPLIFTIPFSSMVDIPYQENQQIMNGANFIKNVMSGFVIFALFSLLFSGEWRKHVLPLAVMGGYLVVLVFSNFAHSERFHFPALGLELMFAAYGVSLVKSKHRRWFVLWLIFICLANVAWAWVKLAGRGMA